MKLRVLCAFTVLLLLGGCGAPASPQSASEPASEPETKAAAESETVAPPAVPAADGGFEYRFGLDLNHEWYLDSNGNDVTDRARYFVFYDVESGEALCRYQERFEGTGEYDEWGSPIARTLRALYDMDGNLLSDWEEIFYRPGVGDLIIRQKDRIFSGGDGGPPESPETFETELFNFRTGETVMAKVAELEPFADGEYLVKDSFGSPLGIVDRTGALLVPPPDTPYFLANAWKGRVVADKTNNNEPPPDGSWKRSEYVLLDRDWNELAAHETISSGHYYGIAAEDALLFSDNDRASSGVIDLDGEVLYNTPANHSLEYYDGELVILRFDSARVSTPALYRLETVGGELLAEGFSPLGADLIYGESFPAERFVGVRDGRAVMLGRDGSELFSAELPEGTTNLYSIGGGFYCYMIEGGPATDYMYQEGLLGADLSVIVPIGTYRNFGWASNYAGSNDKAAWREKLDKKDDLLIASADSPDDRLYNHVLLARDGSVITDGISNILDVGPNRIAVTRGFSVGLMDWEGNWIAKRSVFSNWMED